MPFCPLKHKVHHCLRGWLYLTGHSAADIVSTANKILSSSRVVVGGVSFRFFFIPHHTTFLFRGPYPVRNTSWKKGDKSQRLCLNKRFQFTATKGFLQYPQRYKNVLANLSSTISLFFPSVSVPIFLFSMARLRAFYTPRRPFH